MYDLYMQSLRSRPVTTLRDLLDFHGPGRRQAIPVEDVEPAENIMRRYARKGMVVGTLTRCCWACLVHTLLFGVLCCKMVV